MARRGDDAVPQREEYQLGGRFSGAVRGPLARKDQARHGVEPDGCASRLAADIPGHGRRPEVKDKLLKGYKIGDMTYKVHLDGFNLVPYLTGEAEKSPREWFLYCNDDQQLVALRYDNWKIVFAEQRVPGRFQVWSEPFVTLRVPKIFNLRTDPFERADITSMTYSTGLSITSICWCRRRPLLGNSCRRSGSIPSARRPPASTSTMCSAKCRRVPTRKGFRGEPLAPLAGRAVRGEGRAASAEGLPHCGARSQARRACTIVAAPTYACRIRVVDAHSRPHRCSRPILRAPT